jgi:hypothetical protein
MVSKVKGIRNYKKKKIKKRKEKENHIGYKISLPKIHENEK